MGRCEGEGGGGLKESRTRACDLNKRAMKGEGRGKEAVGDDGGGVGQWESGGREKRSLQRWAFLSPAPARSKVYRGFNFTFPQPIRAQLLLPGEL